MKSISLLLLSIVILFGNSGGGSAEAHVAPDLTMTWVGIVSLIIFIISYYFVATEERYEIDKAKPALLGGTFLFFLIGAYYAMNGLDINLVHNEVKHLILEIAEIFFFLFVAMTYIESMLHMGVFDRLKYNLVSKGYTYKKLYWLTGILAFFISPVADNLTTALILSTVLITIEKENKAFLVPGAINIVVAANAGGAWSPFGDITTLMAWTANKGTFIDFLYLFPASFLGYFVTAYLLSLTVPSTKPHFDASTEKKPNMTKGAEVVIGLGVLTITTAVLGHQLLHLPAMWGMMFGLALLKMYAYRLKRVHSVQFDVFGAMAKIENNTLLFFFGILASVGALYFLGWLTLASHVYSPDVLGPTAANIGVGFLSAIVDNVPVMSAVLKASPDMSHSQWMLVVMTAGVGGSLISFGSAAGVGVMGKLRGMYTFGSHMKYSWAILVGYIVSVAIWYVQFEMFGIGAGH